MLKEVRLLIAKLRTRLFEEVVEWEILHRIFPQIDQKADYGYGFGSEQEINTQNDAMLRMANDN